MKTISQLSAKVVGVDLPDMRDSAYPALASPSPGKTGQIKTAFALQSDGFHGFYQLPDGKTTAHYWIPISEVHQIFEAADSNFKVTSGK